MQYAPFSSPSMEEQKKFWNRWVAEFRKDAALTKGSLDPVSLRRGQTVLSWLESLQLETPAIIELGCANGWLANKLSTYGPVTAVDLADETIARCKSQFPRVNFVAGDVMQLNFPMEHFDVAVSLETISCIEDQSEFLRRIACMLKLGGYLLISTHNKFVFDRRTDVAPLSPGQVRKWTSLRSLKKLISPHLRVVRVTTNVPAGHKGILRLVNSTKINTLLRFVMSQEFLNRIKERLGFGQTIVILAQKTR